jgi:hypothetical protein
MPALLGRLAAIDEFTPSPRSQPPGPFGLGLVLLW